MILSDEQIKQIKEVLEASNAEGWTVEEDTRVWELYAKAPNLGLDYADGLITPVFGHPAKLLKCTKEVETYYPSLPDTRFIVNSGQYVRNLLDTIESLKKEKL